MSDKKKKPGAESFPKKPRIVLTMSKQPKHSQFTRFLSFRNRAGKWARLPVAFAKKSGLTWKSSEFPEGVSVLRSFVKTGNRNYWDDMYLENRGGKTELPIAHLLIEMRYEPFYRTPIGLKNWRIPIVDGPFNRTLRAGSHRLSLNLLARSSRIRWAGLSGKIPKVVRRIAADLGKSGSDGKGQDKYGKNPKYGGAISDLCSEFVSWYYYECGVKVAGRDFLDVVGTSEMHNAFLEAKRLYYYKNSDNTWRRVDDPTKTYTPKAGDYLERRGPAGGEHSMMMLRWDGSPSRKEAIVFNGPWPVTLRRVRVDFQEMNEPTEFYVGRVAF